MKNKLEDLRNHLFAALEGLADQEKPLDIERARAIAEVSQTIINSAKVELDAIRTFDQARARKSSGFFPSPAEEQVPERPALRSVR